MYFADIMDSVRVPTSISALFKLVKTLISANMHGMCSTCVVHQLMKQKLVESKLEQRFGMKSMD